MTLSIPLVKYPHGKDLPLPSYATPHSAGLDLAAAVEESLLLKPFQRQLVPTGFSIALPPGYEAQIRPRSGLALKHGLTVLNTPGTIDADYRDEIKVILINLGQEPFVIERGIRIAQMVIAPVSSIQWREATEHQDTLTLERSGGFGSTGLKA